MNYEYISPNRVRVTLSLDDIISAGLNLESGKESDIRKLKKYLLIILAQIKSEYGFPAENGETLCIEIYPDSFGGAEIYFSTEQHTFGICQPYIFCFYDSNSLIDAAVRLFSCYGHRLFKSALYQYKNLWLFLIRPFDGTSGPAINLLSEYGHHLWTGATAAAIIEEHCKPIIRERASDMIYFYFG